MRIHLFAAALAVSSPAAASDWEAVSAIFAERCVACHSGEFAPLGLRLDSHAGVMAGSENGAVLDTGDADASTLMQRLRGTAEPQMPLDGPPFLDEAQIAAVAAWIAAGAPGPAGGEDAAPAAQAEDPRADGRITWSEVKAVFGRHCIECHSENSKMEAPPEGLALSSLESVLAGGDRIALVPGRPEASEIVRRIKGLASPRMPFDGPPWLDDREESLIVDWIAGGALDDAGNPAPIPAGGSVRFRGVLTAPDAIDGAVFAVTGSTRIDDLPPVGGQAEMRGRIAADGSIVAERLRDR